MFWFLQVSLMAGAWVGHNHIFGIIAFFVFILNYFHNFHNISVFLCVCLIFSINLLTFLLFWGCNIAYGGWESYAHEDLFSRPLRCGRSRHSPQRRCVQLRPVLKSIYYYLRNQNQFILCHSCLCNLVSVKLSHWILYSNSSVFRNPKLAIYFTNIIINYYIIFMQFEPISLSLW